MTTYPQAIRQHTTLQQAHTENPTLARDLWDAMQGGWEIPPGYALAAADTLPAEHLPLLASDDVAAAFAFDLHWRVARRALAQSERQPELLSMRLRETAREAWAAFSERATSTVEIAQGFGWDMSAAWSQVRDVTAGSIDVLAIRRIAALAGRMYGTLRGAATLRVKGMPGETYGVEQGAAIDRLLPSVSVLLAEPALEVVALELIASRRAPQYAVRGQAKRSKGPLVIALDESGSMKGARNEWAKAVAITLARVAAEDGRPIALVHFSSSCVVRELRPRDPADVLSMIQHFLGGGTNIGLALQQGLDRVELLARKGMPGADVILVTDGIDGHTSYHVSALDRADTMKARLWTVAVETDIDEQQPLRARAAGYTRIGGADLRDAKSILLFKGAA